MTFAWPLPDFLALEPAQALIEGDLTLPAQIVRSARVGWQENADHSDVAGESHGFDQVVHRHRRVLGALRVVCLVPDALAALVGTPAAGYPDSGHPRPDLDDLARQLGSPGEASLPQASALLGERATLAWEPDVER